MKQALVMLTIMALLIACGGKKTASSETAAQPAPKSMIADAPKDDGKGIGEFKNVELTNPLVPGMVENGKAVYEIKCAACHKLTDQRVVGPGWAGITKKRKPEWIMNMVTNVDVMLAEDPEAQRLLEECLVRMPNQNLSPSDARDVLEFMRQNDGEQ